MLIEFIFGGKILLHYLQYITPTNSVHLPCKESVQWHISSNRLGKLLEISIKN